MKKVLSVALAVAMLSMSLYGCGSTPATEPTTPTEPEVTEPEVTEPEVTEPEVTEPEVSEFSGDVTLDVMLMPDGDMNASLLPRVAELINARIADLGYEFKVSLRMSGGAWGFDILDQDIQTGGAADIIPAHTWSGSVTYTIGAQSGTYLRLDDPENNLLEKYGPGLYGNTIDAITSVVAVPGTQGTGIYGYIWEKDSVQQLGFLVNQTELEALGFTLADFDPNDLTTWEPLMQAYVDANPGKYPLNVEGEVLDRAVNHVLNVSATTGPIGVVFNNDDPSSTDPVFSSRYENPQYLETITQMNAFYQAGFVDPDQGVVGEVSANSVASRRTAGDFLISTFVYAPGADIMVSQTASDAQGKDVTMAWVPAWSTPIATAESALATGLAVYSGTEYAPEAVTFLNMMATDEVIGNAISEGIEGETFTIENGILTRAEGRGGYAMWRYGVVGCKSAATPCSAFGAAGEEWTNQQNFNSSATGIAFGLFLTKNVDAQNAACVAVIDKYAVPLGSGALDPAEYDTFITELKAAGIDAVVEEALLQLDAFKQ